MTTVDGAQLAGVVARLREGRRVPALSAAAGRGGEVVWTGVASDPQAGDPTPEHAFRIGSITKPMVAVAVLRLVEEGKVALHDPIGVHLPEACPLNLPVPGGNGRAGRPGSSSSPPACRGSSRRAPGTTTPT